MEGKTFKRRNYSHELKAEVVAAGWKSGALVSAVARSRGLSANMIRRWIAEDCEAKPAQASPKPAPAPSPSASAAVGPFVPVQIGAAMDKAATSAICVEVQRGPTKIDIAWPTTEAGQCSAWLREWLK